jgi:N-acetylmuramoyl-L-alanine amidase
MPLAQFQIYNRQGFQDYLNNTSFTREILFIQNHHTWYPDYTCLNARPTEMYWLETLRRLHIHDRGWSDIGQNLTTFPSGNIGLCRPIDIMPAGIFGANKGAICIENLGNFDVGKDVMTINQRDTIIFLNAALCRKFDLSPNRKQIVYHHWFDLKGELFADARINNNQVGDEQKSCPGTGFFGTNTIASAEKNFFPLIATQMQQLETAPVIATPPHPPPIPPAPSPAPQTPAASPAAYS